MVYNDLKYRFSIIPAKLEVLFTLSNRVEGNIFSKKLVYKPIIREIRIAIQFESRLFAVDSFDCMLSICIGFNAQRYQPMWSNDDKMMMFQGCRPAVYNI